MKYRLTGGLFLATLACAQSRIDLARQAKNPDFSALPHTRPIQVGATLPASCAVGELFFNSSAADRNTIYACIAPDYWSPAAANALGSCTSANNSLSCPGDILSGTGANAGKISFYQPVTNGSNAISVGAPDSIAASYTLLLPASGPQPGQTLAFTQADANGVAQGAWLTPGAGAAAGPSDTISLYGTSGNPGNAISISVPPVIPSTYTLELPASRPLSGQSLAFGAPDGSGVSQAFWQTPGAGQAGGASLFEGTYANLPGTCSEGTSYIFTDSLYTLARCTSGTWHHFFDGKLIAPPSSLGMYDLYATPQVSVDSVHGYEQMTAPAGSSLALRTWPAPASSTYTQYVVMRTPAPLDVSNYRFWNVGFADASGKSHVLTCGVGAAVVGGFWCRITRQNPGGQGVAVDGATLSVPYLFGTVIVALQNDGTRLHFGISTDGNSFFELGSVGVSSFLSSPSRLVYGFQNSAAGQNLALNFLGVLR